MAAPTKTKRTLQASATNTAGSSTPSTLGTGSVDLRTTLGMLITTKITNGGTGPTIACTVNVYTSQEASPGSTDWKLYDSFTAGTTASGVYERAFRITPEAMWACIQFTGNTAQSVTVESFGQEFTSFA